MKRRRLSGDADHHAVEAEGELTDAINFFDQADQAASCGRMYDLLNKGFDAYDRAAEHVGLAGDRSEELEEAHRQVELDYSHVWSAMRSQCLRK